MTVPPMLHVLEAENGAVALLPEDRPQGTFLVGGQGSGKTSAMLRLYLNDLADPNATVIVLDPKSELAGLCLRLTPPDCGKPVHHIDLHRPAFGMTPLRLYGDRTVAEEAALVADAVVASLSSFNAGQVFESSKRYLNQATIGAMAAAAVGGAERGSFEDIYTLLLPGSHAARAAVAWACHKLPDLDPVASFFEKELPGDLKLAASSVTQKLDPPRNKTTRLVTIPSLRRFFAHTTDIPLRSLIEQPSVLIVDLNMARVGQENATYVMHFFFQQLHREMQRQRALRTAAAPDDPIHHRRVALLADEAHYLVSENVIDQIATHRAAGLDVTLGLQFLAQLGAEAETPAKTDKIRKGAVNLLANRFLFRLGDPDDAETATRIAQSVYTTMIRDDTESRGRMRVTPEAILNLPRHYCLASWLAEGSRAASFIGRTYPMPQPSPEWAEYWLTVQAERCGPYPETIAKKIRTHLDKTAIAAKQAEQQAAIDQARKDNHPERVDLERAPDPDDDAHEDTGAAAAEVEVDVPADWQTRTPGVREGEVQPDGRRRVLVDEDGTPDAPVGPAPRTIEVDGVRIQVPATPQLPPLQGTSRTRTIFGNPGKSGRPPSETKAEQAVAPDSIAELAVIDRIIGIKPHTDRTTGEQRLWDAAAGDGSAKRTWKDVDYAILALLDRVGIVNAPLILRAIVPGRSPETLRARLVALHAAGLIAKGNLALLEHDQSGGRPPQAYKITKLGLEHAQRATPPSIHPDRKFAEIEGTGRVPRLAHDLHALAWLLQLERVIGPERITDFWRTPRYATGHYDPPPTGRGNNRRPLQIGDIELPGKQTFGGDTLAFTTWKGIAPDLSIEVRIDSGRTRLTFDLLVELDRTARPSYNQAKFIAYDQFLTAWWSALRRQATIGNRPAVVWVCPTLDAVRAMAAGADKVMGSYINYVGDGENDAYYPGRDHTFFAVETDLHHGDMRCYALPQQPPATRLALGHGEALRLREVSMFPPTMSIDTRRGPSSNESS